MNYLNDKLPEALATTRAMAEECFARSHADISPPGAKDAVLDELARIMLGLFRDGYEGGAKDTQANFNSVLDRLESKNRG